MSDIEALLQTNIVEKTLDNGLTVCLIPRPGYHQTFAMFSTKYGSIDNTFVVNGKKHDVPDGIAHFLEHKMFEDEEQEVFAQFAEHGGSVNAFTTFDQTAYYFSCTSELHENLEILLNFVQRVYLTDENVEKEKGIIAQEIRMGEDNPDRNVFMDLLTAMYHAHPVRIDIAGSVESITEIDRETLLSCYNTFYHPSNMILVIAGGFDPDDIMNSIVNNQTGKKFERKPEIERVYPEEPSLPRTSDVSREQSVSVARCLMGWKEEDLGHEGDELIAQELLMGLILDALFGKTSVFYGELLKQGLIDKGFSWEYEVTDQYGYTVVGGNSPNPNALTDAVREYVAQVRQNGIDEIAFERAKRKAIGRFMMSLDQVSYLARSYTAYRLRNADFFRTADVLSGLTLVQANDRLARHLQPEHMVISQVTPKK